MKQPYLVIRKKKNRYVPHQRPSVAGEKENLSGHVQDKGAAEGEERFARMLYKRQLEFVFESNPTSVPTGSPGWLSLDYIVKTKFGFRAFELDDMEFIHSGQREKAESLIKDIRRLEGLNEQGYNILKIEHIDVAKLDTQENANKLGQELFG